MQINPCTETELGISKRKRKRRRRLAAMQAAAQTAYEAGRQSILPVATQVPPTYYPPSFPVVASPVPTYPAPAAPVFPSSATTYDPSVPALPAETGDYYTETLPQGLPSYIQAGTVYPTEEPAPAGGGMGWIVPAALLFMALS